jgi:hypothetical protein
MAVKNYYPELPIVPYENLVIPVQDAIDCLNDFNNIPDAVKKIALTISYNETGGFKSVVGGKLNNLLRYNVAGFQGDNARWKNTENIPIVATTVKNENMTGNARRFLLFNTVSDSLYMLAFELQKRNIYLGAPNVKTIAQLAQLYWQNWVTGTFNAIMPKNDFDDFIQLYTKCDKLI